jgi:Family of unknown function (DUF6518)
MAHATRSRPASILATPAPGRPVAAAVLVAAAGLALGVLTLLGQGHLSGGWLALVNSGALWLLPAFVAGSLTWSNTSAGLAGAGLLVAAVAGYYAPVALVVAGASANSRSVAIWVATALAGGPVYGVAGRWWRGARPALRWKALGLVGGASLAEGLSRLRAGHDGAAGWAMVAAGALLPIVLGRSARDRVVGLAATVPVVLLTAIAYAAINWAFLHS